MLSLTIEANIFYISASEITRNELPTIIAEIKGHIEESEATYSFIFIEAPPFRWGTEVQRQMRWVHNEFEGKRIIHDLILPSHVFREMQARDTEQGFFLEGADDLDK